MEYTCSDRLFRIATIAAAASVLVLAACSKRDDGAQREEPSRASKSSSNVAIVTYKELPDVPLTAPDGTEYRLSHFRGNIVILCLFATWNRDGAAQVPVLNALHEKYKRLRTTVVGIVLDDDGPAALRRFIDRQQISFPVFTNGSEIMNQLGGARKIPTTFILLRDGHIFDTALGLQSQRYFEERLTLIRAQRL